MADSQIVKMFKAVSDNNRLKILELIGDSEICSCKLLEHLKISQPTLSHHLRILSDCGLIVGRKDAQWIHYSIDKTKFDCMCEYLASIFSGNKIITDIND